MPRIRVATAELAQTFRIWLSVIGQRRSDILRHLVTHKGETRDQAKVDHAKAELAREFAERLERNQWHVMREELQQDRIWQAEGGEPLDPDPE
jgi:hypothetical protein